MPNYTFNINIFQIITIEVEEIVASYEAVLNSRTKSRLVDIKSLKYHQVHADYFINGEAVDNENYIFNYYIYVSYKTIFL